MDFKHCIVVLLLALAMLAAVESSSPVHDAAWGVNRHSHDDVGDMIGDDNEMLMDSDVDRRQLMANTRYLSYKALLKDKVPCGQKGSSYYNCDRAHSQAANTYRRGCEFITRCARSMA